MAWSGVPPADEARLLRTRNVVGVGIAKKVVGGRPTDEPCIVVLVERKVPKSGLRRRDLIPEIIGTMKTDVVETGEIRALQSRTGRVRPAPGGVSIGHYRITAGTLGVVVRRAGVRLILSNNHVLANSNDAKAGRYPYPPIRPAGAHWERWHAAPKSCLSRWTRIVER